MSAIAIILGVLGLFTLAFSFFFIRDVIANKSAPTAKPLWITSIIGFVTDFFDTLGIGSFAPTTALFKATKSVDDGIIPGTLNVAHTLPVVLMSFIFITSVEVEIVTLATMLASATLGAWLGAGVVAKFSRTRIQIVMGFALLATAALMALRTTGVINSLGTGHDMGLSGGLLVAGIVGNFILGALMTAGVGLYAPCMALVYLLGMNPLVAFPIMMGSCAFLMTAAGIRFVREQKYAKKESVAISIFGCVGVIIAAYIVRSLPLTILTYVVIGVVVITSVTMLRSAHISRKSGTK